jgi:hypothetical protein
MKQNLFFKSIKTFNPKLINTTIIDFIYAFLFLAIILLSYYMLSWAFGIGAANYALLAILTALVMIISFALVVLNMAFFKNIVWSMTMNRKRDFIGFLKFTAVWFFPWLAVVYLLRSGLSFKIQIVALPLLLAAYLHFTAMARLSYKKSVKKAFLQAFDIGFWKFPKFMVPYLLIMAVFWAAAFITSFTIYLNETLFVVVTVVALFVLISWSRYYISLVYSQ